MPRRETTLSVIRACRNADLPAPLGHALLVLATYYPHIWPGQARLAADMGVSRRQVNRRLGQLEALGLIVRYQRGRRSTAYQLQLPAIRLCDAGVRFVVTPMTQEDQLSTAEGENNLPAGS